MRYESDPDFDAKNPSTWYDGDLIRFKKDMNFGTQCLFEILKINIKENKIRVLVNSMGHGAWFSLDEVVWVARPLFP